MRVVFAANRALPLRAIAEHLVRSLAELPLDAVVLLRRPLRRKPYPFEELVADLCGALDIKVEWCKPEPGGREKVLLRNITMTQSADLVIAYLHSNEQVGSGTAHLVDVALESEVALKQWVWDEPSDALDWLGEA